MIRIVMLLSVAASLGCGSSQKSGDTSDELREDPSWTETRFDQPVCTTYVSLMSSCRTGFPAAERARLDAGMKMSMAELKGMSDVDAREKLCEETIAKAEVAFADVCPNAFPKDESVEGP